MSELFYSTEELKTLAGVGDAVVAKPEFAACFLDEARKVSDSPRYLGVLAVLRDVCVDETGKTVRPEDIVKEGVVLTDEESIFRDAGVVLAGAGELWLHRIDGRLTEEQEEIVDQIVGWRAKDRQAMIDSQAA